MQSAVLPPLSTEDAAGEIADALAQMMSSLAKLETTCRNHGADPMALIVSIISARAGGGARVPEQAAGLGDVDIVTRTRELIDAMDRGDVAAVAPALAPGYVHFVDGATIDRDAMLLTISQRSTVPYIAKRDWSDECVIRKHDVIVFTGKAHEVRGGNETYGGYARDGWYLVQWVRADDAWQVQLASWQKAITDRAWWNETFQNGRGFSREPNRLLTETVANHRPGTALDIAMGQGRNALYLAAQGWDVTGVDVSDEALRLARAQAADRDVTLETINADIDQWDFGVDRFDLVTLLYAGEDAKWFDKIKASLRAGGVFVLEGWAKVACSHTGFAVGQLASYFAGYEILRDETVEDVPDWAWDKGKLVRFVARKP